MSDIVRKRFYDVLSESVNNNDNFYLTNERYNSLLSEVKEAKSVKEKQTVHYRRLKRYDILNIGGEEKLTVPLSAEKQKSFTMLLLTNCSTRYTKLTSLLAVVEELA
jgi:hypothetical protein